MKIIKLSAVLLASAGMLTACGSGKSKSKQPEPTTYQQAKKQNKRSYKLAYFENRANDDESHVYYALGYYKNGNLIRKNIDSSEDKFTEVINPNINNPFLEIKDGKYYIYRAPYNVYNQPLIKGKVTAKESD